MNKRANIYLNIYSSISFLLGIVCIGYSLTLKELSYNVPTIFPTSILILGCISGLIFISIELFLFLLLKNKMKGLEITLTIISLVPILGLNAIIPFSGFIMIILLGFSKDIIRVLLVDKIFIPKEFNRYCKMFNIKIKDFPKKKEKMKQKERSEVIKIPQEDIIDKKTSKKKTSKKSPKQEATI